MFPRDAEAYFAASATAAATPKEDSQQRGFATPTYYSPYVPPYQPNGPLSYLCTPRFYPMAVPGYPCFTPVTPHVSSRIPDEYGVSPLSQNTRRFLRPSTARTSARNDRSRGQPSCPAHWAAASFRPATVLYSPPFWHYPQMISPRYMTKASFPMEHPLERARMPSSERNHNGCFADCHHRSGKRSCKSPRCCINNMGGHTCRNHCDDHLPNCYHCLEQSSCRSRRCCSREDRSVSPRLPRYNDCPTPRPGICSDCPSSSPSDLGLKNEQSDMISTKKMAVSSRTQKTTRVSLPSATRSGDKYVDDPQTHEPSDALVCFNNVEKRSTELEVTEQEENTLVLSAVTTPQVRNRSCIDLRKPMTPRAF